jgi:hypothetical protein
MNKLRISFGPLPLRSKSLTQAELGAVLGGWEDCVVNSMPCTDFSMCCSCRCRAGVCAPFSD